MTSPRIVDSNSVRDGVRLVLGITLILCLSAFASFEALFAPKAELWPRWQSHDQASPVKVDHDPWTAFLDRYVTTHADGINRLSYRRVSEADRANLNAYIASLTTAEVSQLRRQEQLAYWINLYNALTVQLILHHPDAKAIRDIDISPGFLSDGPWGKQLVQVEDEMLSLNDIEHRVLRPIWNDPRIHYVVNCAALGCPNLQRQAFTADNTESLLDAAARAYVNHPRGAAIAEGKLIVSSIYVWFQDDFGGNDAGVIEHLRKYAGPSLTTQLAGVKRIEDHAYDWSLNADMSTAGLTNNPQRRAER